MLYIIISLVIIVVIGLVVFLWWNNKRTIWLTRDEFNFSNSRSPQQFGVYKIISYLSSGYFSTAYIAEDTVNKTKVVLRILRQEFLVKEREKNQFKWKGDVLTYLSQKYTGLYFPQDVRCGEETYAGEKRPFIVSKYIDGISLEEAIAQTGRLALKDSLMILKNLSEAISSANKEKIWLGDLSPRNIVLKIDEHGKINALVVDVGIMYNYLPTDRAKIAKQGYYAPESRTQNVMNAQSEVYALAALMYKMHTGLDPAQRKDDGSWNDIKVVVGAALQDAIYERPNDVEELIRSLNNMSVPDSEIKEKDWLKIAEIIHTRREQVRYKVYVPNQNFISTPIQRDNLVNVAPVRRSLGDRFKRLTPVMAMAWVFSQLDKGIKWIFDNWKRIVLFFLVILIGIVALFKDIFFPLPEGLVKVEVFSISDKKNIKNSLVTIEFRNEQNSELLPITLSSALAGDSMNGRITTPTDENGFAKIIYKGEFNKEKTVVWITANKEGEFQRSSLITRKFSTDSDNNTDIGIVRIRLRPLRKGSITFSVVDQDRILNPSRLASPEMTIGISAVDVNALPLQTGFMALENEKNAFAPGVDQITFKCNLNQETPYALLYAVPDSTKLTIKIRQTPPSPFSELNSSPSTILIAGESTSYPLSVIFARPGNEIITYTFTIVDKSIGAPIMGIGVKLGNEILGITGQDGKVTYQFGNFNGFWSASPVLKFDASRTILGWTAVRDYPLQPPSDNTQREFIIPIESK